MKKALIILLLLIPLLALAAGSFEIEAYDINIKAERDGNLRITETLDVRFLEDSHGIYRDIQYEFDNPNGNAFDPVKAEIANIKATSLYKTEKEDGVLRLTLGDPKEYASERERYVIEYDYHLDYNRTEGYDEIYYNIISPAWDATIRNITWSITLPSPVERDRIWVTEGKTGGTRAGSFTLGRNNTVIEGEKDLLLPQSAITLRVEMDEGYWKGWATPSDSSTPFVIAGSLVALIFALSTVVVWVIFGRDKVIDISGTRSIPPEGITPMDAGFIIDQTASPEKEGLSMIFKWAEEGRLTVKEVEGVKKGEKTSYTFTKLKDLDEDAKESEKALFNSVFFKDEVTMQEIVDYGFANTFLNSVLKALTKENKSNKERKSVVLQTIFLTLGLVLAVTSAVLLSMRYPGLLTLLMALCFAIPSFLVALISALWSEGGKVWKKNTSVIIFILTLVIVVSGAFLVTLLAREAMLSFFSICSILFSYLLYIIAMALSALMDKKSDEGNEKLKKCIEYRNYLVLLLEGKLNPTEEDKNLWGTHMAYALALGVKTKGENLKLDMPQPSWFYGSSWHSGWFTYYILFHSCSTSYTSSVYKSASSTSHPGGGGFSSSGFSGGGFSGGGGGSW